VRIALLSPAFWPEVRRGTERFVRELGDALIAAGHRPTLITSHRRAPSRAIEDGLEVIRNWRPPDARLRRRMFEEHLTHVPFSYLSLQRGRFDLAHAFYPTDALAAARWARRTGKPSVLSFMGIPHRRALANRRFRTEITIRAFAEVDATVALSEAAALACERWIGVRPRVIYPGIDLETFSPGGVRAEQPTIVCAAALEVPRKRIPLLLEAFAIVRRRHSAARLVLSRPKRDDALRELDQRWLDGIELADLDDVTALAGAYRSAWVSALPSRDEAFGLVLAEALACGTPVVGSQEAGIGELLDARVGRLFSGEDPAGLADALLECVELARDPSTAAACRARAEPLSRERTAERYLALYRELIAARS